MPTAYLPPTFNRKPIALSKTLLEVYDWGDRTAGVPELHKLGIKGKGIRVGIVDTGKSLHPDLKYVEAWEVVEGQDDGIDRAGHGSHVASIVRRIAPECELVSIKALGDNGSGSTAGIAKAIRRCVDSGCHIINLSLGGGDDPALRAALDYAAERGVLLVAASGNSGGEIRDWPGLSPLVACTGSLNLRFEISQFSSYGDAIDCAAPGENVLGCDTRSGYVTMDGTSMATPSVAGMAALWLGHHGLAGKVDTKAFLARLEKYCTDRGAKGYDVKAGWGQPTKAFVLEGLETANPVEAEPVVLNWGDYAVAFPAKPGHWFSVGSAV